MRLRGLAREREVRERARAELALREFAECDDVTNEHVLKRKVTDGKPVVSRNLLKPSLVLAWWENDCHRLL